MTLVAHTEEQEHHCFENVVTVSSVLDLLHHVMCHEFCQAFIIFRSEMNITSLKCVIIRYC